jgi:hypothetical protein
MHEPAQYTFARCQRTSETLELQYTSPLTLVRGPSIPQLALLEAMAFFLARLTCN